MVGEEQELAELAGGLKRGWGEKVGLWVGACMIVSLRVSGVGGMAGARACVWFVDAGVTGNSPTRRGRRQG